MNEEFLNLYNQFLGYIEKNDEGGARAFLVENFKKFPESVQDKLTFLFFEEALHEKAEEVKAGADIQREGIEAITQIDQAKKILQDKIEEERLRSNLSQ